jgi:CHAD domain-containing protein
VDERVSIRAAAAGLALQALAREILADARAALDDSARPPAIAIHDFRKAMKRWRALLRVLAPVSAGEARLLRDQARDDARALAGPRDWQSALDALHDLDRHREAADAGLSARSLRTVSERIAAARQEAEGATLDAPLRMRLAQSIGEAAAALERWRVHEAEFDLVAARLTAGYRRARQAMPERWDEATAADLHEFRQRVVIHRYQMDLVEPLWPKLGRLWTGEAQRLRERLGSYQDLDVLRGLTAPRQGLAPWRAKLAPLIDARQAQHARAAQRLAARLFAEKPAAFRRRLRALWAATRET